MLHIALDSAQLAMSKQAHFQAICGYLRKKSESYRKDLFQAVTAVVPCQQSFDEVDTAEEWSWLEKFILADVAALKKMTENEQALKFDQFLKLYKNRFCAGAKKYVDDVTQYNGYTFIKNLHITVCPYCDAEYLDVLESGEKGTVRTLEIDHYFPKKRYPGLAMCFYNLVPSGQGCNGIKLEQSLGMNPFETDIEAATKLYPDLPIGINMENVPVEDCTIRFHPGVGW